VNSKGYLDGSLASAKAIDEMKSETRKANFIDSTPELELETLNLRIITLLLISTQRICHRGRPTPG
jgi:hypothetical protein